MFRTQADLPPSGQVAETKLNFKERMMDVAQPEGYLRRLKLG